MSTHGSSPRSAQEQARVDEALRDLCEDKITFNKTLGLQLESLGPEGPIVRFDMRPELVGHYLYGRLHGGVISATLDLAGGLACMLAQSRKHQNETAEQILQRFAKLGTIDLRIDYLRPGIGKRFYASALVTRLGGRIGSTQMRLESDAGTIIATGAASYVIS